MINFKSTPKERNDASTYARIYDENDYGENVLGVPHEDFIRFIYISKVTELAFVRLLKDNGIKVKCPDILVPCAYKFRKGPDLVLVHSNQEVDVKAANEDYHIRLLVREDQFQAHVHDLYVGSKSIDGENIEYHGYVTGDYLENVTPRDFGRGPCRHEFLENLTPIENFLDLCIKGKKVI